MEEAPLVKQASFSTKFALTDVYPDRLPSNCPYVGSFHRGHSVSDQQNPTYDVKEDRVLKNCPYIGVFNHSKSPKLDAPSHRKTSSAVGKEASLEMGQVVYTEDMRSQASTPPTAPADPQEAVNKLEQRGKRSQSLGITDDSESSSSNGASASLQKTKRKVHRHRSWADLTQFTKQQTPELCGLQAILPRESGVRILDKLGEGTFAKVVLALNKRNSGDWNNRGVYRKLVALPKEGEKLVLKCVRKEESLGCDTLECLQREVQIHSQCVHPNIPTMYGFYDDGRNVTMILDYIAGKELKGIIANERMLEEPRALLIMLQTLRALAYLHQIGFAHRDISPRNVLVSDDDKAFLIDLGLAVDVNSQSDTNGKLSEQAPGTLGYVAPEAMRGDHLNVQSDMWGLGCILYEMLFGFSPFLPHEVLTGEPVPFPDASWGMSCSPAAEDLISLMLAKDPAARISAAGALQHAAFAAELHAKADALCDGDQRRREESRAACPTSDGPDVPPASPSMRRLASSSSLSSMSCLAVNLETPEYLESTVGDHSNFLATVLHRGVSIDEESFE